uniref:Protein kinase domain-containing protein n=1 Tax=Acrobeloides nanus TaxID=290746 RepID=A0A914EEW2_9BILA
METIAYWTPEKFIELEEQKDEETSDSNESDTDNVDVYSLGVVLADAYVIRLNKSEKVLNKLVESNLLAAVWSLGITILEIAYGKLPYEFVFDEYNNHENILALQNCIRNAKASDLVEKCLPSTYYSDMIREFVRRCLEKVKNRPDFEALKNMEFYRACACVDTKVGQQQMAKFITEIEEMDKSQQSEQQEKTEIRRIKSHRSRPKKPIAYKLYKQLQVRYNTMKQINETYKKTIDELQRKLDHKDESQQRIDKLLMFSQ